MTHTDTQRHIFQFQKEKIGKFGKKNAHRQRRTIEMFYNVEFFWVGILFFFFFFFGGGEGGGVATSYTSSPPPHIHTPSGGASQQSFHNIISPFQCVGD